MRYTIKSISQITKYPVRQVFGLILGAALAHPVLAMKVINLDSGGISAGTVVAKPSSSKLTLGLDVLLTEYQAHQQAVASGATTAGTFVSQETMARVIEERVVVDVIATGDAQVLKTTLEALGAEVTAVVGRMISARLPLEKISALENIDALAFARPALAITRSGAVTSQGDLAQRSDLARTNFSVNGLGSIVGVLSDSFDCSGNGSYTVDIGTGDLPAGVNILDDTASSCSDEGRAMAQIVHDVAPGAGLAFHTAFTGEADFAQGILDLAVAGATIIVDDVFYFAEPMFQDGVIAQAVDTVDAAGVSYFSSAGNNGREAYEAAFDDSGLDGPNGGTLHDFDPGPGVDTRLGIQQLDNTIYAMQWQDPFFSVSGAPGAGTNLDICFYSPVDAATAFYCSSDTNTGGDPVELINISGVGGLEISIERLAGPVPDPVKVIAFGSISFIDGYAGTNASTVYGHSNAAGANAVGASAYFNTPEFGQDPPLLNSFSSAGNTPILFDTAGTPISVVRQKPEFTAPDGGNNTFFGSDYEFDGFPNFFGTSAAAPHAAAVAALMREVNPVLMPGQITAILQSSAIDILARNTGEAIGSGYDNDSGSGLIDAQAAVSGAAALTVNISAASFSENGGSSSATVSRNSDTTSALIVDLVSDDTSEATVPDSVTIAAGQSTSPSFTVTGVDDAIVDGTQVVTITATAAAHADGSDTVNVTDDDSNSLTVSINDSSMSENGGSSNATVTRNHAGSSLSVTLVSNDTTEATVPGTVTISAGQSSAGFTVTGVDDNQIDGSQTITVTASATGFDSGSDTIEVTDDDYISLEKTATPATYLLLGEQIQYTYIVTNESNVDLDPGLVSVIDDKVAVTCPAAAPIAPQAEVICQATHFITQDDLDAGFITNKATADVDGVSSNEQTVTVSRLSEACYDGALTIPDGQIFSGAGTTRLRSSVSIDTGKPATQGTMVEPPHELILMAPFVEFNPLFEVGRDDIEGGAGLQVIIDQVNCP